MDKIILVSNSCLGVFICKKMNCEYKTPFASTLIPDDDDYLKLCSNIIYYVSLEPTIDWSPKINRFCLENNGPWASFDPDPVTGAVWIKPNYSIIHLQDIDIHCPHETNSSDALANFNKRRQRSLDLIKTGNYKIINLLSFSELRLTHDYPKFIESFMTCNEDKNVINIFVGPPKYNKNYKNYIEITEWDTESLERTNSRAFKFNNHGLLTNLIFDYIQKVII